MSLIRSGLAKYPIPKLGWIVCHACDGEGVIEINYKDEDICFPCSSCKPSGSGLVPVKIIVHVRSVCRVQSSGKTVHL